MIHRIRFTRHAGGKYWRGDVAGFPLEEARYFVDRGRAVWVDPPPNGHDDDEPDVSTHDMTVADVRGLVADTEDEAVLRALRDSEARHPRYEGGRTTALDAIDARLEELKG